MTAYESSLKEQATSVTSNAENLKPLKIALLGYRSHPFVGGQGIYIKYLSRALSDLGHHVDVYSGPPYPDVEPPVNLIKVPSLDLFTHENHVTAIRPKHLTSYTDTIEWASMLFGGFSEPYTFGRRVYKRLKHNDYDIIHDNQSLCYALLHLQKTSAKIVSTIHHPIHRDRDIALDAAKKWGDKLLIKRWYSFLRMQEKVVANLNHVVTVSQTSQRDIETYFKRDRKLTQVIPNGIDTARFAPQKQIEKRPYRVITTASSDQPSKGLPYLLEAIDILRHKHPEIKLCVVGQLKENSDAEKLLQKLRLENHVSFVSGLSTEALVEEYSKSRAMVCPSLYEGFGLPLGEAMACGLPVITTDGGALPEVAGDAGLIVKCADADAIASKLSMLFENPKFAEELGRKARARIEKHFSWQTVAQDLTRYYRDILCSQ